MEEDWSVLLKPTARRLLQILLEGPASLTAMALGTGLSKPAILRHLRELERLGVLTHTVRTRGAVRDTGYTLEGCTLHVELRPNPDGAGGTAITWAAAGFFDPAFPLVAQIPSPSDRRDVATALRALQARLPEAWDDLFIVVFGSAARGETTRKSDIDLMLVVPSADRNLQERVSDILAAIQPDVNLPLQPFYVTREDFLAKPNRMEAVAARDGVVVHANPQERELWTRMKRYATISP